MEPSHTTCLEIWKLTTMGKRKGGKAATAVEVKVEDQPEIKQEENIDNENLTDYELQRLAM